MCFRRVGPICLKSVQNYFLFAGHFTQVVWKGTQELGLGMATKSGRTVIVATYNPPGNYIGEYTKNVMKPK